MTKPEIEYPRGGADTVGRKYVRKTTGSSLDARDQYQAGDPAEVKRKGFFLKRWFEKLQGPLTDAKGRLTELARRAERFGEKAPRTEEDARQLAVKGRRILKRYGHTEEDTGGRASPAGTPSRSHARRRDAKTRTRVRTAANSTARTKEIYEVNDSSNRKESPLKIERKKRKA